LIVKLHRAEGEKSRKKRWGKKDREGEKLQFFKKEKKSEPF